MATKQRPTLSLEWGDLAAGHQAHDLYVHYWAGGDPNDAGYVGRMRIEILEGNVVITVEREDEAKFGPVSLVVV